MTDTFEGQENDFIANEELSVLLSRSYSRNDTDDMVEFREFFDGIGAQHFKADEFMVLGPSHHSANSACRDKNAFAGKTLWNNVVPLVKAMDAIRAELGASVTITNCYRNTDYNACVGGVSGSFHLQFKAADFVCSAGTSADWAAAAARVRANGGFAGGIGIYNSFVHVDVRGSAANWDNR